MYQDQAAPGKENQPGWPTRRVRTPEICAMPELFSPSAALNRHGCRPDYRAAWGAHADRWAVLVEATVTDVAEAVRDDPAVLGYCGA